MELADASQPPQHVGEVAAEDAAVGVQFVDDHIAQVAEQFGPLQMVRQDTGVQHVGVGEEQAGALAGRGALTLWRVAVVGGGREFGVFAQRRVKPPQLGQLIVGQRLGGEEIERTRRRAVQQRLRDRQVVAKGLAAGGRCDDHPVLAGAGSRPRRRLMGVEAVDALRAQRRSDA